LCDPLIPLFVVFRIPQPLHMLIRTEVPARRRKGEGRGFGNCKHRKGGPCVGKMTDAVLTDAEKQKRKTIRPGLGVFRSGETTE